MGRHADHAAQIEAYLDDPFDPHAIAALRPIAYRKAIVMAYLDNLLNWADMLFGEYTRESINEARMLYVEAWDVLGRRPESLGGGFFRSDSVYDKMPAPAGEDYDMLVQLKTDRTAQLSFAASLLHAQPGAGAALLLHPANEELDQYWTRVADRLYKIRHGLNILGVKQPLALFRTAHQSHGPGGRGGGRRSCRPERCRRRDRRAALPLHLPGGESCRTWRRSSPYLGSELLGALEKRDVESLSRLQATQEGIILTLTRDMQKSQLAEAQTNLSSLQKAKENAQKRQDIYQSWVDVGYLPMEVAQIDFAVAAGS